MFLIISASLLFIPHSDAGTTDKARYTSYIVSYGETYWGIAESLKKQGYCPKTDIRIIVDELINKSGITAENLKAGDTIKIPKASR